MTAKPKKQAILLIHGIGEQRPMDTLRGFVNTVWTRDPVIQHPYANMGVFSKPDDISESYELRRLTTTKGSDGVTNDFYEFYWAHLMSGTSVWHVLGWTCRLICRSPSSLPPKLKGAWYLLVTVLGVASIFAILTALPEEYRPPYIPKLMTAFIGSAFAWGVIPILKNFVGDAARYLDPAPTNVKRRQEIRAKGIEILKRLHESGKYDRIIVVGHSLGSVIGYDILTHAWMSYAPRIDTTLDGSILSEVEETVAKDLVTPVRFQEQQQSLMQEAKANHCKWLVTDFVTLGSPLTHAEILLARNKTDLEFRQRHRELPTCPPQLEKQLFSYPHDEEIRTLHHAAVFGVTRWTNLYFPAKYIVYGDFVGGPVSQIFGKGIRDCEVRTKLRSGFLSHTLYWAPAVRGDQERIDALRDAFALHGPAIQTAKREVTLPTMIAEKADSKWSAWCEDRPKEPQSGDTTAMAMKRLLEARDIDPALVRATCPPNESRMEYRIASEPCLSCQGTGHYVWGAFLYTCSTCFGTGKV